MNDAIDNITHADQINLSSDDLSAIVHDVEFKGELEEISPHGRIGIVALATDYNLEQDIRRMLPETVEAFTNRVLNQNPLTLENLKAMEPDIERAAAGVLPGQGVNVMIYGCTSGTAAIGYDNIKRLIHKSNPGIPVVTPLTASCAAFEALSIDRVSVLTPYDRKINLNFLDSLIEAGVGVNNLSGLGFDSDIDVTKVTPESIVSLAMDAMDDQSDALFISCTSFRASLVIEEIEQRIGKPVVSSNQALAWHCLRHLGYQGEILGYGQLFTTLKG